MNFTSKSGKTIIFRPLEDSDMNALFKWAKEVEAEDTYILLNPHEPVSLQEEKRFLNSFINGYKNKKKIIIGAFYQGDYLGSCSIEKIGRRQNHVGRFGIALAQSCRGEGIGHALANYTIDKAQKFLGIKQIVLNCFANNATALNMYKKLGFIQYGIHPKAVQYKDQLVDEVMFYKDLQ